MKSIIPPFEAGKSASVAPPGSLLLYAGTISDKDGGENTTPEDGLFPNIWGYLVCNGDMVEMVKYPELYQAIGTKYNHEETPKGLFTLPDYSESPRPDGSTWLIKFSVNYPLP